MCGSCQSRFETYIGARAEEEESAPDQEDVEEESNPTTETAILVEIWSEVFVSHSDVGRTPEDESKE